MTTTYFATITNETDDNFVTFAYGAFPVANFAVKSGLKEIEGQDGDFSAKIVEVENIGEEDEKRTVVSVRGDAETVGVVVKRKMANERKQYNAENPKPVTETEDETASEPETV